MKLMCLLDYQSQQQSLQLQAQQGFSAERKSIGVRTPSTQRRFIIETNFGNQFGGAHQAGGAGASASFSEIERKTKSDRHSSGKEFGFNFPLKQASSTHLNKQISGIHMQIKNSNFQESTNSNETSLLMTNSTTTGLRSESKSSSYGSRRRLSTGKDASPIGGGKQVLKQSVNHHQIANAEPSRERKNNYNSKNTESMKRFQFEQEESQLSKDIGNQTNRSLSQSKQILVKTDPGHHGKRSHFQSSSSHLLQFQVQQFPSRQVQQQQQQKQQQQQNKEQQQQQRIKEYEVQYSSSNGEMNHNSLLHSRKNSQVLHLHQQQNQPFTEELVVFHPQEDDQPYQQFCKTMSSESNRHVRNRSSEQPNYEYPCIKEDTAIFNPVVEKKNNFLVNSSGSNTMNTNIIFINNNNSNHNLQVDTVRIMKCDSKRMTPTTMSTAIKSNRNRSRQSTKSNPFADDDDEVKYLQQPQQNIQSQVSKQLNGNQSNFTQKTQPNSSERNMLITSGQSSHLATTKKKDSAKQLSRKSNEGSVINSLQGMHTAIENLYDVHSHEEMHFVQVEFNQKCKQWMNRLENPLVL